MFLFLFVFICVSSKIVRWNGILIYDCQLLTESLISCDVLKDRINFPLQIASHCSNCVFVSANQLVQSGDKILLKDNDEFLEYKIVTRGHVESEFAWILEPQIRYEEFQKIKAYTTA